MLVVAVESPPGGGKGFLLKYMASKGMYPLHGHIELQGDAISHVLDLKADASRWALFTELYFLASHVLCYQSAIAEALAEPQAGHIKSNAVNVVLLEGSPVSDRLCYFERRHKADMHPLEVELYMEWYQKLEKAWHVDHHILLLSDMHAHMERIIDNAKVEQAGIGLDDAFQHIEVFVEALPHAYVLKCPANFEDNEPMLEELRAVTVRLVQALLDQA